MIAVVDDDPDVREAISDVLRDAGYGTLAYAGGREALAGLRSMQALPCLILLDLMMPGMTGWEFRDEQLRDPVLRQVPVVVITASRDLARHPISANEILRKPLDIESLLSAVAKHRN
jgi:CheY-like chemotaxis protein